MRIIDWNSDVCSSDRTLVCAAFAEHCGEVFGAAVDFDVRVGLRRGVGGNDEQVRFQGDDRVGGAGEGSPTVGFGFEFQQVEALRLCLFNDGGGNLGDGQLMLGEDQPRLLIAATDGVASAGSEVAITGAGDLPAGEGGAVLDAADAPVGQTGRAAGGEGGWQTV